MADADGYIRQNPERGFARARLKRRRIKMKSKQEILKMTKQELWDYKWSDEIKKSFNRTLSCSGCSGCSDCLDCSYCSDCLGCSYCSDCSYCLDCSYCSGCSDCLGCSYCSDCLYCLDCRNVKGLKYAICNVKMTKKEYEKKVEEFKELKAEE